MYQELGIDDKTGGRRIKAGPLGSEVIVGKRSGVEQAAYDIHAADPYGKSKEDVLRSLVDQGMSGLSRKGWEQQANLMRGTGKLGPYDPLTTDRVVDFGKELGVHDKYTNMARFRDNDAELYGVMSDQQRYATAGDYGFAGGGAIPMAPAEEAPSMPPQAEGEGDLVPVPLLLDTLELLIQKLREQL